MRNYIDPLESLAEERTIDIYLSAAILICAAITNNRTPSIDLKPAINLVNLIKYALRKGNDFLIERRPKLRSLSNALINVIKA